MQISIEETSSTTFETDHDKIVGSTWTWPPATDVWGELTGLAGDDDLLPSQLSLVSSNLVLLCGVGGGLGPERSRGDSAGRFVDSLGSGDDFEGVAAALAAADVLAAKVDNRAACVDVKSIMDCIDKPGNPAGSPGRPGRTPGLEVSSFEWMPTPGAAAPRPVNPLRPANPANGKGKGDGKPGPSRGEGLAGAEPVLNGGNGLSNPFLDGVL